MVSTVMRFWMLKMGVTNTLSVLVEGNFFSSATTNSVKVVVVVVRGQTTRRCGRRSKSLHKNNLL